MLNVSDVVLDFGGIRALDKVSFSVGENEICGLIGPNGAGKTSLFNCITRIYQPNAGSITFQGTDLLSVPRHRVVRQGISRTFQNLALWPKLTVLENTVLGAHSDTTPWLVATAVGWPSTRAARKRIELEAWQLLERLDLTELASHPAAGLPFGTLKRVELARALISRPALLLLDEPAGGLTHSEVDDLGALIRDLQQDFGFSALLVEHHMGMVMRICDHVVAMDFGSTIADGSPDDVKRDPAVVAAYLGNGRMSMDGGGALLQTTSLSAGYGQANVLHGIDLRIDPGQVVVVLGANGAGKTTLMRALAGLIPFTGSLEVDGEVVGKVRPDQMVKRGVSLVPQGRGTLTAMSVIDNLRTGAVGRQEPGNIEEDIDRWFTTFPRLAERRAQVAGTLSGGEQQMLAIARALMSRPRLLLCDEISLGLAPVIVQGLFETIRGINEDMGTALLLVEQNAALAMKVASYVYLLEVGEVVQSGDVEVFAQSDTIRRVYLGY